MIYNFLNVLIFLIAGITLVALTLRVSRIIHPRNITEEKLTTYECGEEPVGNSWIRFNNRFYVVALIFIIFDVEVVFMFPWALVYKELGLFAFVEMMIFILILLIGFAYVWVKGDLEWVKSYFLKNSGDVLNTPND